MALHKMLDLGPEWPARGSEAQMSMPSQLLARREELVCDGLYARRHTRLIAAPTARQTEAEQVRSCRANPSSPSDGMWTPETPRER